MCWECYPNFNSQNELNMHMQVHRPCSVACPICGNWRFRTGANAVQHVENGSCSGCQGRDNARRQIYNFARQQQSMQGFMNGTPLLTNGGNNYGVPDYPYQCPECYKSFRQLSQLMQHQDQKHNNTSMRLGYWLFNRVRWGLLNVEMQNNIRQKQASFCGIKNHLT